MNESGSFLIETCDESVVLELEESLLLNNRRWKEICDAVDSFRQTHTSEQRARYMYFISVMFNNPIYFSILTFELGLKLDIKLSMCIWYCGSYALLDIFTQLTKLYFNLPMSQNLPVYNIYLIDPSNHHNHIYTKLLAALGL